MHAVKLAGAAFAAALLATLPAAAQQQQQPVSGTWVIRQAAPVAPWVASDATQPTDRELRRLAGGRVTFRTDRISGPAPLACRGPHYAMRDYTPDMLFQGNLPQAEPQATALGFTARPIHTIETGCAGAIDFHMLDDNTMLFALNDRIYTLDRVRPSPRR
jgi:hypothetical protein